MKKNDIELEKYIFVGDSNVNEAYCVQSDGSKHYCTQTDVISALVQNKKYIKGGSKINVSNNSNSVSYLINYGTDENKPKEMIKITFDKNNLLTGDPNALAIDSICKNAITIKKNNIKKTIVTGMAVALIGAGLAGAMVAGVAYADKKEMEYQTQKNQEYVSQLDEERIKNGVDPIGEDSNIDYENLSFNFDDEVSSKSR